MKKTSIIILLIAAFILAGCSHNASVVGVGKVFKIGSNELSIMYVNGLFSFNGVRENSESVVETNDSDSITSPVSGVSGVRSIRFRTGPQISGNLVKLAKKNSAAAEAYVKAMPELNKTMLDPRDMEIVKPDLPAVSPEAGHKTSDASIADKLKEIWDMLKKKDKDADESRIEIPVNGDGVYTDLWKNPSIAYQAKLAKELLKYANDTQKFESGETYKITLAHYIGRLAQLAVMGKTEARIILIDRATIKDGVLVGLMYRYTREDGTHDDADCPNCYEMEE